MTGLPTPTLTTPNKGNNKVNNKVNKVLLASCFALFFSGMAQAGNLKGTIVEENGGSIGDVSWEVQDQADFATKASGAGAQFSVNLAPGRYMIRVNGSHQGSKDVVMPESGDRTVRIEVKNFF